MRASTMTAWDELLRYRYLLWTLTWRDVRVRYKQSWLGIGWAVLLPVSMMLVFTFVFTRVANGVSGLDGSVPYALYACAGLVPWTFFSSSLNACVNSLVANRNLITKIHFPREVLPLSCVLSCFVDFCVALLFLVGLMFYYHATGRWSFSIHTPMLLLPLIIVLQVVLTTGLGMMLAMAHLFYRDVRAAVGIVVQLWMFISAVVVPVPTDGSPVARLMVLNPVVHLIHAYRDCLIYGRWPQPAGFAYAMLAAVVLLLIACVGFRRASYRFAECI